MATSDSSTHPASGQSPTTGTAQPPAADSAQPPAAESIPEVDAALEAEFDARLAAGADDPGAFYSEDELAAPGAPGGEGGEGNAAEAGSAGAASPAGANPPGGPARGAAPVLAASQQAPTSAGQAAGFNRPVAAKTTALKVPPHSVEAEQSVLGGLMLDNDAWFNVAEVLGERDFYRGPHRIIFEAMTDLSASDQPIDAVTVAERLQSKGLLEKAGGLAYLAELAESIPGASNVVAYSRIVREHSTLRQLIGAANRIAESAFNTEGKPSDELLNAAEQEMFRISEGRLKDGGPERVVPLLSRAVERIEKLYATRNPITGLSTGFEMLDKKTAGLQPSDLIIVAGRPSMGKTSIAMNMVEHAVMAGDAPVLVFSMEMPSEQLVIRMLSSLGRIDQTRLRTGEMHEDDWPRFTSAVSQLKDKQLFIDDTPALTPNDLRTRARRVSREAGGLGLIVVDYLQLMRGSGNVENRTNEISEISRSLKAIAKEMRCPLVALSQLNRGLENRTDKRPVMADLRECVPGNTLVDLADGSRAPIEALVGSTPEVLAMGADERIVTAVSDKVWRVGMRPVFRLSLRGGQSLTATARHRVYTSSGWRRVDELRVDDRLAVAGAAAMAAAGSDAEVATLPVAMSRQQTAWRRQATAQGRMAGPGSARAGGGPRWSAAPGEVLAFAAMGDQAVAVSVGEFSLTWERVVSITSAGDEEVFDLTVPGPASWLSNGIVNHNSGAIEQDADVILFVYRDEVYNPESDAKGTAELIIGKQRNGPIGMVRLSFIGNLTKFENLAPDRYADFGPND